MGCYSDYLIHESIVNRNLISFHNVMDDMVHLTQYSLVAVGGSFNSRRLYRIAYHRAFYYVVPESHNPVGYFTLGRLHGGLFADPIHVPPSVPSCFLGSLCWNVLMRLRESSIHNAQRFGGTLYWI